MNGRYLDPAKKVLVNEKLTVVRLVSYNPATWNIPEKSKPLSGPPGRVNQSASAIAAVKSPKITREGPDGRQFHG